MTLEQIINYYAKRNNFRVEERTMYTHPTEGQELYVQQTAGSEYQRVFYKDGSDEPYVREKNRFGDVVDMKLFNFFKKYKGQDYHSYRYLLLTPM